MDQVISIIRSCSIVIVAGEGEWKGRGLCEQFYNVYSCNTALRVVNDDDDEGETATAAAVQFVSKSNPLLLLFDSFLRCAKRNYRDGRKSNSNVGIQWRADDNFARKFCATVIYY